MLDTNLMTVTMNVTKKDGEAADRILEVLGAEERAAAVSFALQLADQIIRALGTTQSARLYIDRGYGEERVTVPSLGRAFRQLSGE